MTRTSYRCESQIIESELISEIFGSVLLFFSGSLVKEPTDDERLWSLVSESLWDVNDFFSKMLSVSDFLLPTSQPNNTTPKITTW